MKIRAICGLVLVLVGCTDLTWSGGDPQSAGNAGCWQVAGQLPSTATRFGRGLISAPRDAIRPNNLKWELPIASATGLLIASGDVSVIAHRYPHNFWLKWGAYGLASGVTLARIGGKKHFASDILIGGTLGYVTGTYLATH